MFKLAFRLASLLTLVVIALAFIVGYVVNIIDLVNWVGGVTGELIVRVVGIFIPFIGALMGLFA